MAAEPRPELIFLAGPQRGQRAVLMGDVAVLGRSPSADVQIDEEYVSREHVRLSLTRDGWMAENLSDNPIRINGKKYKRKKVLLDTGDLLAVGMTTEVLFVGAGDGPEEALKPFGGLQAIQGGQAGQPAEAQGEAAPASPAAQQPPAAQQTPAAQPERRGEAEGPKTQAVGAEAKEQSSSRRVMILSGVVLAWVVVLLLLWMLRDTGTDDEGGGAPKWLTDDEIARAIEEPMSRPADLPEADRLLRRAVERQKSIWKAGDPYKCVRDYKEALAFMGRSSFRDPAYDERFIRIRRQLIKDVQDQYRRACFSERQGDWPQAKREFRAVELMLPEQEKNNPVSKVILENVREHIRYINVQMRSR